MAIQFQKATKKKSKLRLAIDGPSGSGKTYTALIAASALANNGRVAVIDTERGSASLYSDQFDFDVLELETFSPRMYIDAIEAAEAAGYDVIVIDSLSHAWEGEGGALDLVDQATKRSQSGNSYTAWKDVTPLQRRLVDAILTSKAHMVVTMRSKTEYVIEQVVKNGRTINQPKKVGMAPIQRSGIEYEFTIFADMDLEHNFMVSKTRYAPWSGLVENKPTVQTFRALVNWLDSGEGGKAPEPTPAPKEVAPQPAPEPPDDPRELIPAPAGVQTPAKMSLESARAVTNSKGERYGDLPREKLAMMANGILKILKNPDISAEQREEYQYKLDAIRTILASE